jgi:outer membrane immunogenic protein
MQSSGNKDVRKLAYTTAALSMLLATSFSANAADVPPSPPAYAPPPVYLPPPFSWTGFYIGGNFGGAWRQGNVTDSLFGLSFGNTNNNGAFIGGGQVGFNYQFGNFVIGLEADFDWGDNTQSASASNGVFVTGIGTIQTSFNNGWITTLAGRFGVTNGPWLFYGKAGGGWVGNNNFTVTNVTTGASINISNNNTNSGWLVGAGIEWAFTSNWSVKIEYDYLGLNSQTFTVPTGVFLAGDTFTTSNPNVQIVKVGLNYLFNY